MSMATINVLSSLVARRLETGLSVIDVADLMAVDERVVYRIESGERRDVGLQTLSSYANAVGVEIQVVVKNPRKVYRPSQQPTAHQLRVLDWIKAYEAKFGRGPFLREIGEAFNVGNQSVSNLCGRLQKHGLLKRGGDRSMRMRSIAKESI
jgi:transcriptional regulator with XRE-family HTH domain